MKLAKSVSKNVAFSLPFCCCFFALWEPKLCSRVFIIFVSPNPGHFAWIMHDIYYLCGAEGG